MKSPNLTILLVTPLLLMMLRKEKKMGLELLVNRRLDGSIPLASSIPHLVCAADSSSLYIRHVTVAPTQSVSVSKISPFHFFVL
jgi:hypothetical protein